MSFRQRDHVMDLLEAPETHLAASRASSANLLSALVAELTRYYEKSK